MFLVLVGIFYENSWHGLLLRFWLLQFPAGEGFNCTRDRVHRWFSRASCSAPDRVPALRSLPDKASLRNFGNRRSEEHTSELQSRGHIVCRLLLEKKNY